MFKSALTFALIFLMYSSNFAFQEKQEVEIKAIPVSDNIYMLTGKGGNIGVSIGDDGIFMIDDQFADLSPKIMAKLKTLSDQPLKFLVNTHYHGDHTGGNTNFQEEGALIFAHENVRKRLMEKDSTGLPVVTFDTKVQLHINKNDILVKHLHNAHTDGDAIIYFPRANVLHTGDTFFNGMFPYIDLKSGGSVNGYIEAAKSGLMLINKNTKIIPGHGPLASYQDYEKYLKMLEGIRDNIKTAIAAGKSREEISKDESLTMMYYTDEKTKSDFINGPKIRETYYDSLKDK